MKELEAKGPILCLGLQFMIKKAFQIPINYSFFLFVKYYLYHFNYYLNIIFESYVVLVTKLSAKNQLGH